MRIYVKYDHDPADFTPIYLSVGDPVSEDSPMIPVYRDTIDGERVVWAEMGQADGDIYLIDGRGKRVVSDDQLM